MRTLIVFGTSEGHTKKVADFIATRLRELGHETDELNASTMPKPPDLTPYDAVIIGSSVHAGAFQPAVVDYVKAEGTDIRKLPSAFFSVSLTAARQDEEHRRIAEQTVDGFLHETMWTPDRVWYVAGALLYRQYPAPKRFFMKQILKREGGETDTSRDHEYTDWKGLGRQVDEFVEWVAAPVEV